MFSLRLLPLLGAAVLALCLPAVTPAQAPKCDTGVVKLPAGFNGKIEVCSAIARQFPELVSKLETALGDQQAQRKQIEQLLKSINSVGKNLGGDRQVKLLESLAAQLTADGATMNQKVDSLSEKLDDLQDKLVELLTSREAGPQVNDALDGPIGDAIARLDLTDATNRLQDIQTRLAGIAAEVTEVNTRAKEIQRSLSDQRKTVPNIASALASLDLALLEEVLGSGFNASMLEEAFRQKTADGGVTAAQRFFERSVSSAAALAWFEKAIDAGLDPNMTVPSDYYGSEAILHTAMRAGNAPGLKILLGKGASPHGYQDLLLTRFTTPRFLYPLQALLSNTTFTLEEKQDLARAFLAAGVAIPDPAPSGEQGRIEAIYDAQQIQTEVARGLGVPLPLSTPCCSAPSPICQQASRRTGEDWCQIVADLPNALDIFGGYSAPVWDVHLSYLLTIRGNSAYFLALNGLDTYNAPTGYVLVEVSKDASLWNIYKYTGDLLGLCKDDDGKANGSIRECWRRISLRSVPETQQLRSDLFAETWVMRKK